MHKIKVDIILIIMLDVQLNILSVFQEFEESCRLIQVPILNNQQLYFSFSLL